MHFYILGTAFTIWMAIETVRNGQTSPWLWICLCFGPLGSAVYFFTQYLPSAAPAIRAASRPKVNLTWLGNEARRLDKSEIWTDYAAALRAKKKPLEAAEAARKAVEKDGENLRALSELGNALLDAGRPRDAVAPLAALTEADPHYDMGEGLYALAQAQQQGGDTQAALGTLTRLTERFSRPIFLYGLAMAQAQNGDADAARASLQTIIDDAHHVPSYAQRDTRKWVRRAKTALKRLG